MMWRSWLVVITAFCVTVSCGDSTPSSPTAPVNSIAGTWTGTLDSTNFAQQGITLSLTQSGPTIGGTWAAPGISMSGTVTGTLSGSAFTGNLTLTTLDALGRTCTGTAPATGTLESTALNWLSQGFVSSCGGVPLGVRISAARR